MYWRGAWRLEPPTGHDVGLTGVHPFRAEGASPPQAVQLLARRALNEAAARRGSCQAAAFRA